MSPFWLVFWAAFLSLAWLLPPLFSPWFTFPADAWMALMTLVGATAVVVWGRGNLVWHALPCLAAGLVMLPWLQWWCGLLPYFGQAWTSSIYLLGFLLALLVGARWELCSSKQLAHGLLLAAGAAAVLSVGLQMFAWLRLADDGGLLTRNRPSANLGQPNQLATLLLWGLLACLWANLNKLLSAGSAIVVASFLLLGIAMTQSRGAMLALCGLLVAIWVWKGLWPNRRLPLAATGLCVLYFAYAPFFQWLDSVLFPGDANIAFTFLKQGEQRLSAWELFSHAVLERPFFGYGWTDTASVQLALADRFPSLGSIFKSSHTLLLDLLLWCGIPLGAFIVIFLIRWFWLAARAVRHSEDAVLFLFLGVVAIHALVEFPLLYGYFLIPVGLIMGVLNIRLGEPVIGVTPRWSFAVLVMAATIAVGITVSDYVRVDKSYTNLRLEQSILGQGREPMGEAPDVLVLTHLREWIRLARYKPHASTSQRELDELEVIATAFPSPGLVYELAKTFAMNDQPGKAGAWQAKICKLARKEQCRLAKESWERAQATDPRIAAVRWHD